MTNSNLTVHNEKNFTFFLVLLFWPLILLEIIVKMAKKNSIEIKASLLRHYFAEKCTITALVQFALAKHRKEVTLGKIDHASDLDDHFRTPSEQDLIL